MLTGKGYKDIKDQLPPSVDVACHNSFDSSTISGPYDDVMEVVKDLKAKGVFAKAVNSSDKSYHSRYIKPVAKQLNELLNQVSRVSDLISFVEIKKIMSSENLTLLDYTVNFDNERSKHKVESTVLDGLTLDTF